MTLSFSWTNSEGSKMNCTIWNIQAVILDSDLLSFSFLDKNGKEQKDARKIADLVSFTLTK